MQYTNRVYIQDPSDTLYIHYDIYIKYFTLLLAGSTDTLLATIAGVVAAAIIVLILMIVVIIVVVVLIKYKKKRTKNKSHTVQVYNDVVDYNTGKDSKPDSVHYRAVREPTGDEDDDSDEGIVEDKVGHSYDDVNKPIMGLQFDQETQEYDDIVTQPSVTGLGPISAGYEDVEFVPPNTTANIKQTMKIKDIKIIGHAVYAVPDKSKKKRIIMKEVDEQQKMDSV